jgi:hypothetical protein
MFSNLSQTSRDEILQAFTSSVISRINSVQTKPEAEPEAEPQTGAFESASLSFGKPLVLPNYNIPSVVRVAENYPIAKANNLYSLAPLADLHRICKEIDEGRFISNSKSIKWTKGSRFHHMDWDVKRVLMEVKCLQPATSLQIDQALPTMDRYRVTAILRELRKQGILIVS